MAPQENDSGMSQMTVGPALVRRLGLHRKTGRFLWSVLVAVVLVMTLRSLWLTALGGFLIVSTPVEPADLVVVLGGGGTGRLDRGIELLRHGYSKSQKLAITGGSIGTDLVAEGTWAGLGGKYAIDKGVPPRDLLLADWTESTYDDAQAIKELMQERGFASLILVSDEFHMRRAMWTMGKAMPAVRLVASPAPSPALSVDRWWTRERELLYVIQEYIKLGMYFVKYGL